MNKLQVVKLGPELVAITRRSPFSGKDNTMQLPISFDRLKSYCDGTTVGLIQNIFPDLTPEQREFLQTGYTPEDWAVLSKGEDDEQR